MSHSWPQVPLGEVLTKSEDWVSINPEKSYKEVTVRLWGKGVALRREVSGAEISASRRLRVKSTQFILSRIDARNGAFGLVPDSLDGAVVSNDFPVFTPNTSRVLPAFLNWMSKTHGFVDICKAASEGTTNRIRLQENRFLTMKISLPPLPEQRRIVARIEELAAKIEEARTAQIQSKTLAKSFLASVCNTITSNYKNYIHVLSKGIVFAKNGISRRPSGLESGPIVLRLADLSDGTINVSNPRRGALSDKEIEDYCLQAGDLLFIRVNGSREIVGRCIPFNSCEEPVCFNDHIIRVRLDSRILDSEYVAKMANSPLGRNYMEGVAITTAGQNTINHEMLRNLPLPIPSLEHQGRIVGELNALQAQVDALKKLQAETAAELDAMLPSILDRAFRGDL